MTTPRRDAARPDAAPFDGDPFDVVVVGATPAGCAAALIAARCGRSTLLVEPTAGVGGMSANGVHCFDTASMQALGAISEEFARRVRHHYADAGGGFTSSSDVYWESRVAAKIWRAMLDEQPGIQVALSTVPVAVEVDDGRITAIRCAPALDPYGTPAPLTSESIRRARGSAFVDATYEGDIAAWAGCPFRLGREPRSAAEPHAGTIRTTYLSRQPTATGALPQSVLPGSTGAGDDRIMAYNVRLTCRRYPGSQRARIAVDRPPGYDPQNYRWNRDEVLPDGQPRFGTGVIPTVGGKFLLNKAHRGNDLVGPNRQYILADPYQRPAYRQRFIDHALGYLYFIQRDGASPDVGLAEDEYRDNAHIPAQVYVREGRRIEGAEILTESDINPHLRGDGLRPPLRPDSIAVGDWAIESKRCTDDPAEHPDGLMHWRGIRAPYQIPYGALVPRGVGNLVVACALSATHVAYCALRVESVWTQTGMAAGAAAAIMAEGGLRNDEVDAADVQTALIPHRGKFTYLCDVGSDHPHYAAIQLAALRGFVPTDSAWRFFPDHTITWTDFVELVVRVLEIPISVSGRHFENLDPAQRGFRYFESLYDLGSAADVDVFPGMTFTGADESADHHLPEPRARWLTIGYDEPVTAGAAAALLAAVAECGRPCSPPAASGDEPLTRGQACSLLRSAPPESPAPDRSRNADHHDRDLARRP